jgi:hypothetical protein
VRRNPVKGVRVLLAHFISTEDSSPSSFFKEEEEFG